MPHREIGTDDNLFRALIFPIAFKRKGFAPEKFMGLQVDDDGAIVSSLAWEAYLPTQEDIHRYGCRIASGINGRLRTRGRIKEKDRHVYCGAYQLTKRLVVALAETDGLDEILSARVSHKVENGEIAHAEMKVVLRPDSDIDLEGTKTAIIARLWDACRGPLPYQCDCDRDLNPHPNQQLPIPPMGKFEDSRTKALRIWHAVISHARCWLLRRRLRTSG